MGMGDDCAVRRGRGAETLVFTTDAMVEHVHFRLNWMEPAEVGYKCMAANVSDCAAMGAVPDSALIELVVPAKGRTAAIVEGMYRGMRRACRRWRFPIVGGNISSGPCWTVSVSLVGRMPRGTAPVLRSGARPGDRIWVSGTPGESAGGLAALAKWGRRRAQTRVPAVVHRHVSPTPRVLAGAALARSRAVHAMIDVSDGVALDAWRIARASDVAIVLSPAAFPLRAHLRQAGTLLGVDPQKWFLEGGEDYELLFAAAPSFVPSRMHAGHGLRFTCIGRVCGRGAALSADRGTGPRELAPHGWDHLRRSLPMVSHRS